VTRPSGRLSPWELIEGANRERAFQAELQRQRAKTQNYRATCLKADRKDITEAKLMLN